MASKLVIKNGIAQGVYDDRLMGLYQALGVPMISRASSCEYSPILECWVAVDLSTGKMISSGKSRSAVLAAEVAILEGRL